MSTPTPPASPLAAEIKKQQEVRGTAPILPTPAAQQKESDQPLPVGNDNPVCHQLAKEDLQRRFPSPATVVQAVMRDLDTRLEVGIKRYGQPLQGFNGRDFSRDKYEELLDALAYSQGEVFEARANGTLTPDMDWHHAVLMQVVIFSRRMIMQRDGK